MIFVTVGTALQPFDRLVEAGDRLAEELDRSVFIQYGYSNHKLKYATGVDFLDRLEHEEMAAKAEVIIGHAGSGKPLVLMPRRKCYGEHVDDHQLQLARAFASLGRAAVVEDAETLISLVRAAPIPHAGRFRDRPGRLIPLVDRFLTSLRK